MGIWCDAQKVCLERKFNRLCEIGCMNGIGGGERELWIAVGKM